ncbi:hypothetical protein T01_4069 [Trichinella spiralis]|uniref:Uncharacterized protein n=1 Tax=Trichinella spiralis TaxID=6334 RepID=A0A0V1BDI7_TRISP|nr:hypothetical protein T01_4069 [Trichinella spiralis]
MRMTYSELKKKVTKVCEFVCEVIGQSEKGKRYFHGFKPNSGTCLRIDVRLAIAMRNKGASERKCTSRHAEVRIDLQQKGSDALKTGFRLCIMQITIAIKVPYCQLKFKEWSKETVITRATWSKSRTSRSKIREQIVIFKTLGKSSSLERIPIALKPLSNAARVESVWPLSTSNLTCGGIVYVLTEFSIAEL